MAVEHQKAIPGMHGIQSGSENIGFCVDQVGVSQAPGIRRVGLRSEIDTSPPFRSVQEAVTRFGGRGSWVPFKLENNYNGEGEFDIKKMEEHAAELEKDLIVKELETLDVLEALGTTKRIVEDLKRQLHQESLRSAENLNSDIKEMNNENYHHIPISSPDLILMELKQAKMNLAKTMNDLVIIQSSIESLNKKMKQELSRVRVKPEFSEDDKNCLKTAEMRLVAARKMEEAAEALAMAEITNGEDDDDNEFCFPQPPLTPRGLRNDEFSDRILKKLEEATEGVKQSKQALEIALNRVEIANVKQLAAENAFRGWSKGDNFTPLNQPRRSFFSHPNKQPKSNVSMRDVLRRKQDVVEGQIPKRNANLSEMLKELKFSTEKEEEKQRTTQRRKFGFIHITLPMYKQSKKKSIL